METISVLRLRLGGCSDSHNISMGVSRGRWGDVVLTMMLCRNGTVQKRAVLS
jgi:hypothetical protein